MNSCHENKVEIVIKIDPDLKDKLEKFKTRFGFTDQDVLDLGLSETFSNTPLDQLLEAFKTPEDKIRFIESRHKLLIRSIELLEIMIKKFKEEGEGESI